MTTEFTTNLRLEKPAFRVDGWADDLNRNLDSIDAIIAGSLTSAGIKAWTPNTIMASGITRIDTTVTPQTYWLNSTTHTSGVTTFAADRAAHPSYWSPIAYVLNPRGQWTQNTTYAYNDLVYDVTLDIDAVCKIPHTSTSVGTITTDVANWSYVLDLPVRGTVAATTISFNNTVAQLAGPPTNVQTAIEAIDARIDTITSPFATGTIMFFASATVPTGWTQSVLVDNRAIRVVSGTGGVQGGTNPFSTVMAQTVAGNHTVVTGELPSHFHDYFNNPSAVFYGGTGTADVGGAVFNLASVSNTSQLRGGGATHNHTIVLDIQYVDIIIGIKN